jgi:hypothetical protein
VVLILPGGILVARHRNIRVPTRRPAFRNRHQPVGVVKRQRTDEQRAHQTEGGGVGADPECEGENGNAHESGRAQEPADGVSQVV